ncbi:MAG TPA: acetylglutamate kinase, partial [Bryobacteraceae bacterium]|nr:acetylglutamate kinase [Bryobacteraceae bacterium]
TEAEPLSEELGAVGKVVRSNPEVLNVLTAAGFLPVVACVAGDRQGRIYNVNADSMAVACGTGFAAERLIFLTDVDGVRGAAGERLPTLTPAVCRQLINDGVATGGMEAKLTSAMEALAGGIGQVVIAPGAMERAAARILAGEAVGTALKPEEDATHA